jgi:hypothetical protein
MNPVRCTRHDRLVEPVPAEPVPAEPEPARFDLARVNRSLLRNAAAIGMVFGVAPLVGVIVALVRGAGDVGPIVAVTLICSPFAVIGVLCGNAWIQALRRGEDWLVVEPEGVRREVGLRPFAVSWAELSGIEVVASQAIPGDNPYRIYNNPRRRAGETTALRFHPRDPSAFAAAHPPLVTSAQRALPQRLIGAPFGVVFPMEYDRRAELAAALQRYAGSLFLGLRDETTAGARRRDQLSRTQPPRP